MLKRIAVAVVALIAVLVAGVWILAMTARDAGDAVVPAGMKRNEPLYVPMRDGVRIAIDVWYPADLAAGAKVPALIHSTRYVRAAQPGLLARAAVALGKYSTLDARLAAIIDAGYVVVLVDARGGGASGGTRLIE